MRQGKSRWERLGAEPDSGRQRLFLAGELVEVWEDPERPFRCTDEEIELYAEGGRWVLLFNALVLAGRPRVGGLDQG